ncbi:hypothetical protein ACET3Z_001373 [Daucus carota]
MVSTTASDAGEWSMPLLLYVGQTASAQSSNKSLHSDRSSDTSSFSSEKSFSIASSPGSDAPNSEVRKNDITTFSAGCSNVQ